MSWDCTVTSLEVGERPLGSGCTGNLLVDKLNRPSIDLWSLAQLTLTPEVRCVSRDPDRRHGSQRWPLTVQSKVVAGSLPAVRTVRTSRIGNQAVEISIRDHSPVVGAILVRSVMNSRGIRLTIHSKALCALLRLLTWTAILLEWDDGTLQISSVACAVHGADSYLSSCHQDWVNLEYLVNCDVVLFWEEFAVIHSALSPRSWTHVTKSTLGIVTMGIAAGRRSGLLPQGVDPKRRKVD